jgi:hypothetical protein
VNTRSTFIRIVIICRLPNSWKTEVPSARFFHEFHEHLDDLATASGNLIILGDLNFHFENKDHPDMKKLCETGATERGKQHTSRYLVIFTFIFKHRLGQSALCGHARGMRQAKFAGMNAL